MKPDRSNYEIWLVDYLDGNLSDEMANELFSFLDENPDIREELSDILSYRIQPETYKFRDKESLKRTAADLSENQFEMLCVAALEKDLDNEKLKELNEIIALSEDKEKTAALINKTKLTAPEIKFIYKSRLKKLTLQQKVFRLSLVGISAAAAFFLLFIVIRNPIAPQHENQASVSLDTKQDKPEHVIPEKNSVAEVKQQKQAEVKNIPEIEYKAEVRIAEMKTAEAGIAVVKEETDTVTVSEVYGNKGLNKIEFKTNVSVQELKLNNNLVAINLVNAEPLSADERPGLNESIAKFFREKILKTETPEKGSLKAYEVADAGINGLNRLFGWNMKLEKNKDEKGEVNSVYFNSRLLKFNAPVKKSEPAE